MTETPREQTTHERTLTLRGGFYLMLLGLVFVLLTLLNPVYVQTDALLFLLGSYFLVMGSIFFLIVEPLSAPEQKELRALNIVNAFGLVLTIVLFVYHAMTFQVTGFGIAVTSLLVLLWIFAFMLIRRQTRNTEEYMNAKRQDQSESR
ncbi:hypothetical protein DH09_15670 [Bacillaceae bacterium JMAK1]|nr:hypothetical protein DH09_15670 [Bacillaceae bacterium JMAK1]